MDVVRMSAMLTGIIAAGTFIAGFVIGRVYGLIQLNKHVRDIEERLLKLEEERKELEERAKKAKKARKMRSRNLSP